jgi:flagellar biosynthetic protein FliO
VLDSASPETTVGGGAANRTVPVTPPVTMPTGSATGSLLQTLFALIVVLAVLGALAWFLKRYGPKGMGGSANLRVVGSLNLGGRERLLVVEIGNQWIVVGASPGRVNALATMPRQESADMTGTGATLAQGAATSAQPANSFADWLKQTIDKRK